MSLLYTVAPARNFFTDRVKNVDWRRIVGNFTRSVKSSDFDANGQKIIPYGTRIE
jgi:hypothetical protein